MLGKAETAKCSRFFEEPSKTQLWVDQIPNLQFGISVIMTMISYDANQQSDRQNQLILWNLESTSIFDVSETDDEDEFSK